MPSYYNIVEGNLHPGDIAKSSDINHIQVHIKDALKSLLTDLHDGESYILGSGETHKNDFIITPAPTLLGRYLDTPNIFEIDKTKYVNLNRFSIKQPLPRTQTSLYSIITKMKNESNRDIVVECDIRDVDDNVLRSNTVTVPANTIEPREFEIVFDLDFYPTAPGLTHNLLLQHDGKDIPLDTKEAYYDEGYVHGEFETNQFSNGVSLLYFVMKRTNLNESDLADNGDEQVLFNPDTDLGVFYNETVDFAEQKIFAYIKGGVDWEQQNFNIFYKDVYSNGTTYLCTGGTAIIEGEKVICKDHHISIDGGSSYGNVLTNVYLGSDGHLHAINSKAANTTDINKFEVDLNNRPPMASLLIAKILTYSSTEDGISKEPLIIQNDIYQDTRPRSHHERLRRLEKQMKWVDDIAVPSRIKYTLSGKTWVDERGDVPDFGNKKANAADVDNVGDNYITTTDSKGNIVVRLSNAEITTIPITLKENFKNEDGTTKTLENTDILNASQFSETNNVVLDNKEGLVKLDVAKDPKTAVGLTDEEAKTSTFNPWDDDAANRPEEGEVKPTEREYKIISGKNGDNDFDSEYPAMTLYLDTNYKLEGLHIPIHKFQNCESVKFYIWKRQNPNDKSNTVWLEKKVYTSKEFSLSDAKVQDDYQHIEEGFNITFDEGGLSLEKGQYVIVAIHKPKNDTGSCFVETYKPKDSKDFCIRYYGAANGSHFLLKERYQEIWYNSAYLTGKEENYQEKGSLVSKTITWTDKTLQKIKYIKPVVNGNLTIPEGCTTKIFADTGSGWKELQLDKNNPMTGGASSFKWKLEFTSDKKSTPELKYDDEDKFAIQFTLTRDTIKSGKTSVLSSLDKNMCLTSIPLDGDEILKQYVGDPGLASGKLSNFEFARIWADNDANKKLLIDINASDKCGKSEITTANGDTITGAECIPIWTMHYCDLTLDDFEKINVDYSNYIEELEYDENNMRLKLDTENSYNDNDIRLFSINNFEKVSSDVNANQDDDLTIQLKTNSEVTDNQVLMRARFNNPIDLTKHTALQLIFDINKPSGLSNGDVIDIKGLGLYISSSEQREAPTQESILDNVEILTDAEVLPDIIDPDVSSASYYDGRIIQIIHSSLDEKSGNYAYEAAYYHYVQKYDEVENKIVYIKEQLHDIKSYNIYEVPTIQLKYEDFNPPNSEGKNVISRSIRIEIDQNSTNLKFAKEIGLVTLNDNDSYSITGNRNITITLKDIRSIEEDYYPIFDPKYHSSYIVPQTRSVGNSNTKVTFVYENGNISLMTNVYGDKYKSIQTLDHDVTQLHIDYQYTSNDGQMLCYINNHYGKLSDYKHVGIQLASSVFIPKDCLKINLCEKPNGEAPFASVNVPTINNVYVPLNSDDHIELCQIFKKINSDKQIKSISITTTKHFTEFMGQMLEQTYNDSRSMLDLFLGKIVLYKAKTIPIFQNKIRYKFYSATGNDVDHFSDSAEIVDNIQIRKIGAVLDYK